MFQHMVLTERERRGSMVFRALQVLSQPYNIPENLIVNYGEVNRQSDYPTVKQESHPPPKKPLPMNPLASPVTEWYKILKPHNVPN